ncbi:helix-turn-helix domain-containing protein [Cohnella faecalis]|uniref:Helix-turn-helix domain-containing protein n=1 Tax=Cohnella faecalis TaxID=2315694 RepID=A0A398CLI1_9BACL|nr:helix-turn-helix domain-containing protein [Cohnella faecalis]RIE00707.1 helix-turn-helix domain-containing protein [Cohnella faecalis]
MYKALIIDDELPARRAIRALGEWDKHGIELAGEADNGITGLQMLDEHSPDLVFVDMKMPLLGGQAFLEQAKRKHPNACYVVISGFDDFDYARSAIQAGSIDYLLKPIRKAELSDVIDRAIALIDKLRDKDRKERKSDIYRNLSVPLVKEKIYSSIIDRNGRFHHISELQAVLDTDSATPCRVAVFKLLNVAEAVRLKFAGDSHAFYFAVTNAIDELLGRWGKAFSFKNSRGDQEIVAVIGSAMEDKDRDETISVLADSLARLFRVSVIAEIGLPVGMDELDESYAEATDKLLSRNMLDLQSVRATGEPSSDRPSVMDKSALFEQAIESGSYRQAGQLLRGWMEETEAAGTFTLRAMLAAENELRLLAESLLTAFLPNVQESIATLEEFDRKIRDRAFVFKDFKDTTLAYFETLFESLAGAGKAGELSAADKVKEYIDLHYFEDMPVSFFAGRFHTSKEHLTRIFKQKYGFGIHEYMLQVRMAKAKEWLADKTVKIQTVSEKVGYRDQNYFSKAFKKFTGQSPQEYRASVAD